MPTTPDPNADSLREAAHEALVVGLRNAHALEKQAVAVLESQLGRMDDYPDLHARISAHVLESREQSRRLEFALDACGASPSVVKDVMMSVMGMGQSSVQGFADDAVMKAVLADSMFEHLEIASYRSLIELAEMAGRPDLHSRLEESLGEEEAMAAWLDENLKALTRRYVEISAEELEADKTAPGSAENAAVDTENGVDSEVVAIEQETRAREARKRATLERINTVKVGAAADLMGSEDSMPIDDENRRPSGSEMDRADTQDVDERYGAREI